MNPHRRLHRLFPALAFAIWPLIVAAEALAGPRLSREIQPVFQAIQLDLDPRQDHFSGSTEIDLEARATTQSLRFHFAGKEIQHLSLHGSDGEVSVSYVRDGEDAVLVEPREPLTAGRYRLKLEFTAVFGGPLQGVYRVERDGSTFVFSVFQPIDARRSFPCWDQPEFKIPFQLTLTVPEDHLAISNTPEHDVQLRDGRKTVTFQRTPPLPSYGVAIASGPFEITPIEGLSVPVRMVTAPGRKHLTSSAIQVTRRYLPALEDYFGLPYPYAKLDLLAVPGFPSGGLENPAAPVFSEDILLVEPDAPLPQRRRQAVLLAHEIAHMWFGNLVTLEWWDDVWLNEAFATWMSYKMVGEILPELEIDALIARQTQKAFELDNPATAAPVRRELDSPIEAFSVHSALTYDKGSQVLTMFEDWLGADRIQAAIRGYVAAHAWDNATSDDFLHWIDRTSGPETRSLPAVSTALSTFLEQPGFPRIEIEAHSDGWIVRQRPFRDRGGAEPSRLWKVPISVRVPDGDGSRVETFLLEHAEQTVPKSSAAVAETGTGDSAGTGGWIYPNAGAAGYYRWTQSPEHLLQLASRASQVLTVSERLDLLSNAASLLQAGHLSSDAYLRVLGPFRGDPDRQVLSTLSRALGDFGTVFIPAELNPVYGRYVRATLSPALERLEQAMGREAAAADPLGAELIYRLGKEGADRRLRRVAREQVERFFSAAAAGREVSLPARHSLQLAALDGDAELFSRYWAAVQESGPAQRPSLLVALAAFPDPDLQRTVLDGFLDGAIGPGELAEFAGTLLGGARGSEPLYRWMKDRYKPLMERIPPIMASFLPLFAGGCSTERLADAQAFFAEPEHRIDGAESRLAQVAEQVGSCRQLRDRESMAVARFLNRLEPPRAPQLGS